jgi:hypothetical protein
MNGTRSVLSYAAALTAAVFFAACEQQAGTAEQRGSALTSDEVLPTGGVCTPNGAHGKHAAVTGCTTCHACGGVLSFDPAGAAVIPGGPLPAFDAVNKTCSNVACHRVAPGTFSYYFPDGNGDPQLVTVTYGSTAGRTTPSWYTTGAAGCTACHDDPPRNGSSGSNAWHSGYHGGQGPTGTRNQCQFCHPDAYSPNTGIGTTITNPSLHANGSATVQAAFTSACFGCH